MNQTSLWLLLFSLFLLLHGTNSEEDDVKRLMIKFLNQVSPNNGLNDPTLGWNMSSDPCKAQWEGVTCNSDLKSVKKIVLDGFDLTGTLDINSICSVQTLAVLSLNNNSINGEITQEIGNCKQLTHLYVRGNKLTGNLPDSFSYLNNLKKLDISNNSFSGELPDFSRISGLISFLAENNQLSGQIPDFDFSNLKFFNVSFNNFSGPIPDLKGHFTRTSVMDNPGLCGPPLSNACPPSPPPPPPPKKRSKGISTTKILMFLGFLLLVLVILILVLYKLITRTSNKEKKKVDVVNEMGVAMDSSSNKTSNGPSSDNKTDVTRSEYSITSTESPAVSNSLVVLTSPMLKGLKFEDLLKAPAELLGRGKYGSLYKVIFENGMTLAVKRIKDWIISSENFKNRMRKIDQVKHPNVLNVVAFYCSKQEKLVVYEYQKNGSLFRLLHEIQNGERFDWGSRLSVAASIAKALAFMHEELKEEGIAHGNLKSSNIMFNTNMEPTVSEYGLMVVNNLQDYSSFVNGYITTDRSKDREFNNFKLDIYGFGVIVLELLTGKLVENNGFDLARWVHSVVREEWTAEVFDKSLIREGASEERMVHLLQIALKCINPSSEARPSMNQVAEIINTIKEEEEERSSSIVPELNQNY